MIAIEKNKRLKGRRITAQQAKREGNLVLRWVLVAVWAGVIFYLSSRSGLDFGDRSGLLGFIRGVLDSWQAALFGPDVDIVSPLGHFCEYTVFGFLVTRALFPSLSVKRSIAVAFAICVLYALTDEWHQSFVPGRECDIADVAVDACGTALGAAIAVFLQRRKQTC